MERGSCPDFSNEYEFLTENKDSWISALNSVNGKDRNNHNTVSIVEMRGKPTIDSLFDGKKTNSSATYGNSKPSFNQKIMSNGHDILSLDYDSVMNMSLSDAHETLFQLRVEGNLMKKGFKRLKLWKLRFFMLSGKMLTYWEVNNHNKKRHEAQITEECTISLEPMSNRPNGFTVLPSKTDRLYVLDALSKEDRDIWIHCIRVCTYLVQRINKRPHLRGIGRVYDHFSLGPVLGKGRYGIVRLAEEINSMKKYAVKIVNKQKVNREILKHELIVLRGIKSRIYNKNVVTIHEIYEDEYLIHIVMEYLGGNDLYERISQNGAFSEAEAARVIRHMARALLALHEQNIYHLDVKPENVIYVSKDPYSDMKLADFGCCMIVDYAEMNKNEIIGSPGYIAPEVILNCEYSAKCDVYGLGILLYILLVGYPPFKGADTQSILEDTIKGQFDFSNMDWETISPQAVRLVKAMVEKDPTQRISMQEVLHNDWVQNPPRRTKRSSIARSIQTLQMSFPSTLPGSKLFANEDWYSPKRESDVDFNLNIPEEIDMGPPSFESFDIPKSVPYDMHIV